jgi:hypothetical protein
MGTCRLGLAIVVALSLLIVAKPEPARAGGAAALAALHADASARPALALPVLWHHSRRVQSYYCYPRNYWWFYRPYTTGQDGHARCMPYFHYPSYEDGRAPSGRYIK